MCCECLKDKKIIALWLSGLFGAGAIFHAMLALLGEQVTILGITLDTTLNLVMFLVSGAISVALCKWACAQFAMKARKKR